MKKAETPEIGFACSFDTVSNHEMIFTFNPNKKSKYSSRKGQYQAPNANQKQSGQSKASKNAGLKRTLSQPKPLQTQNSIQITASQPPQFSQLHQQSQPRLQVASQQVPLNSQAINQQNQSSINPNYSKSGGNDQNIFNQTAQPQKNIQSNQANQSSSIQQTTQTETGLNDQINQQNSTAIQIQNSNSNANNTETANLSEQQKQINEQEHLSNQSQNYNISNSSLAFKNPIYQQIFHQKKPQQTQSQPQIQPAKTQSQQQKSQPQIQPQTQSAQIQPIASIPNNQAAQLNAALLQALFLKTGNFHALPSQIKLQVQMLINQLQHQQSMKMQKMKEQMEAKTPASKKRSKNSENDDFYLKSENSNKKAKLFIPASTTMYSTHHRHHKPIQDFSDEESDTYVPCTSSSNSPQSSSSNESDDEEKTVQVTKHTTSASSSSSNVQIHSHTSSRFDHSRNKDKKVYIKPLDPRIKLKRRYASWAEITDYGQWKWAAKDRPHIIENPRETFDKSKSDIIEERSKPLEFNHEFTLLECLKVVSDNLSLLKKDVTIVSDINENKEEMSSGNVASNSDSNMSKSSSISNLSSGIPKSDSVVSIFSADKISLASVISPVITKRRAQRPNHIKLANIIDNFDNKTRSITCRACNMLDRLLLREILKNSAPSLHQSLQQIAPYVWREFQTENLQSSAKPITSTAGSRRKKKKAVTLTAALAQSSDEVEDAFHVIKQTFEFLNISEKEETNYECEIRHMNFSQDYTFQPSFDDLVRYFRRVKGKFVSRSSSGYVLE